MSPVVRSNQQLATRSQTQRPAMTDPIDQLQGRSLPSRRTILRGVAGGTLAATLPACASPERLPAVPTGQAGRASVLGVPNERFFPASNVGALEKEFYDSFTRLTIAKGLKSPFELPKLEMLAISGGGENGAFGAGLLCGWTDQGTRPEFEVVTGISTGALTAPFPFLGPAYDAKLKSVYTQLEPKNLLIP